MYEAYWGLKEKPFENTPNPHFFYYSQKHEEALSRLLYALRERKGAALLTGEPGSGKTLLSRVLLEELNANQYQMAFICNPLLPPIDLIKEIVYQLDNSTTASDKIDLLHSFNNILCLNKTKNKSTVVVIDEAQTINYKYSFEELRLLLNYQLNKEFLLTLILLGQPELKSKINRFPQLKQRFAVRYHLNSLNQQETRHYILHRLKVAGAKQPIFSEEACVEVFRFSTGIPRRINNICDMALLVGSAEGINLIVSKVIREVAEDLEEVPIEIT